MSSDGIFLVSIAATGNYVINDPVITSIGVVVSENKYTIPELIGVVKKAIDNFTYEYAAKEELSAHVRKSLRNYLFKKMREAPMVVVNVLEV